MKIFCILLICSIVALGQSLKPNDWCSGQFLTNVINSCAGTYGAIAADIVDYRYLKPSRNEHIKCFRACQMIACSAYTGNGYFAANVPETTAFAFTRKNSNRYTWNLVKRVAGYCTRTIEAKPLTNICHKTEELVQCLRVNLPAGLTMEGAL